MKAGLFHLSHSNSTQLSQPFSVPGKGVLCDMGKRHFYFVRKVCHSGISKYTINVNLIQM